MRIFLAIDIPEKEKEKLDTQINHLKEKYPHLQWVPRHNYHITIQFFGEVQKVDEIVKKIEDVIYDVPSFYLYSQGAGIFINHKILLYADFQRQKILEDLAEKIKTISIQDGNYTQQHKYGPHLTLARYKIPSKQQYLHLKKKLEQLDINIEFLVNKVTLYNSILQTQAPVYQKIAEFSLL